MTTEEKDHDSKDGKHAKASGKKPDSDETDDSAAGLEPTRPKVGESKDNLKKRSDYFQKRHGGG